MAVYEYVVKFDEAPNSKDSVYWAGDSTSFGTPNCCFKGSSFIKHFPAAEDAVAAVEKYNRPFTLVPIKKVEPLPEPMEYNVFFGDVDGRLVVATASDISLYYGTVYRVRTEFLERLNG